MNVDKLLLEAGAYFGGDGVNYDRFEPRKFANLVAAKAESKEREACAKVCDDEANNDTQDDWGACNCCSYLAKKIRVRGEA